MKIQLEFEYDTSTKTPQEIVNELLAYAVVAFGTDTVAFSVSGKIAEKPPIDIAALKARSGLNTHQIGRIAGVGFGTVAYWAAGGEIPEESARQLRQLEDYIERADGYTPEVVYVHLFTPDGSGTTPFAQLVAQAAP